MVSFSHATLGYLRREKEGKTIIFGSSNEDGEGEKSISDHGSLYPIVAFATPQPLRNSIDHQFRLLPFGRLSLAEFAA